VGLVRVDGGIVEVVLGIVEFVVRQADDSLLKTRGIAGLMEVAFGLMRAFLGLTSCVLIFLDGAFELIRRFWELE
jgi:hypothetical protein